MTILVVGATGATGRLLVRELLNRGEHVKVVVRSSDRLPEEVREHANLTVIPGTILDRADGEIVDLVRGCDAVASCLGHNLTLKGVFGKPRRLVTETTRRVCQAIKASAPQRPVRFALMNTVACLNREIPERFTFGETCVIELMRVLVPPQPDNEQAAEFLRTVVGHHDASVEWVAVRPDSLTDAPAVSAFDVYPSPIRSGIFDPGKTSRINVGHFMASLITDDRMWQQWKGQMPVIYNRYAA